MLDKADSRRTSSVDSSSGGFSWRSVVGILCMNIGVVFWAGLNIVAKIVYNSSNISAFEFAYFRCMFAILISFVYVKAAGVDVFSIPLRASRALLLRVVYAMFGFAIGFWALKLMSYSKYVSLSYIYPIITQVAAYFLIGERLTVYDALSCVGSFFGVIVIETHSNSRSASSDEPSWAFILPIITACFWALGDVYQRKLRNDVHFAVSPMYQYFGGSVLCALLGLVNTSHENVYTVYTPHVYLLLFICAALGTAGTVMYAIAFQLEKAGRLSPYGYLSIPYALVVGYFYFHDDVNGYNVLGAFLIMIGSCAIAVLKGFGVIQ